MKHAILALMLAAATASSAMAQTVVLVRHAEKADQSADPMLSEAGQARSAALSRVLADMNLTQVFATPLQRTRLTGEPAAAAHGLTVEAISLEGGGPAHVARVAERIRALPGDAVVLVVGHSNTVPEIARALGQADAAPMSDCEYDRLTLVTLSPAGSQSLVGRYGAPTTAC